LDGSGCVLEILPKPGLHEVYNIEVEVEHCYLVTDGLVLSHNTNPCATPAPRLASLSDEQFAREIARRAELQVGGSGRVNSIRKHSYAAKLTRMYQGLTNQRTHLRVEISYRGGQPAKYGTKGSARPDLYDPNTGGVYDYKFVTNPGQGISTRQQMHNRANLPSVGRQVEINP